MPGTKTPISLAQNELKYPRGLALNFASTHLTENPLGFSEVGENKQLLIAIVVRSVFLFQIII